MVMLLLGTGVGEGRVRELEAVLHNNEVLNASARAAHL